jgi:hypothetical protein
MADEKKEEVVLSVQPHVKTPALLLPESLDSLPQPRFADGDCRKEKHERSFACKGNFDETSTQAFFSVRITKDPERSICSDVYWTCQVTNDGEAAGGLFLKIVPLTRCIFFAGHRNEGVR